MLFDNEPKHVDAAVPETHEKMNLPGILLEPLHVLDPLCIKWKLSKLSVPVYIPEPTEEPVSAPVEPVVKSARPSSHRVPIPTSSRLVHGYVRLMGLHSNGSPWDCNIPTSDMAGSRGVTIGRDGTCCDVVLPEASISRRHVLFELTEGGTVVITDLNSTNGTVLNGRRLSPEEAHVPLEDGSILTLGDITLRVEILPANVSSYIPM